MQLTCIFTVLAISLFSSISSQNIRNNQLPNVFKWENNTIAIAFNSTQAPSSFTEAQLKELANRVNKFKSEENKNKNKNKKGGDQDKLSDNLKDNNNNNSNNNGKKERDPNKKKYWAYDDEATVEREEAKFEWCKDYNSEPGFDINLMLKLVNEAREKVGAKPLRLNKALIRASLWQAKNQKSRKKGGHDGPDGPWDEKTQPLTPGNASFGKRVLACKFPGFPRSENAADNAGNVTDVMRSWMDSPGHRENIEDKDAVYFGAGRNGNYWVQAFGIDN